MFSVAICDDEPYFREQMKEMLWQYMQDSGVYYKIDLFQSGMELIELGIELNQYKIISTCAVRFFKIKEILGAQI